MPWKLISTPFISSFDIEIAQKLSKFSLKRLFIATFIWRIYNETWMLLRPDKFIAESTFTKQGETLV